jgi:hypothetical protein
MVAVRKHLNDRWLIISCQSENPFPMQPILREHTAAELPISLDSQVFTFAILTSFGTGGQRAWIDPLLTSRTFSNLFRSRLRVVRC